MNDSDPFESAGRSELSEQDRRRWPRYASAYDRVEVVTRAGTQSGIVLNSSAEGMGFLLPDTADLSVGDQVTLSSDVGQVEVEVRYLGEEERGGYRVGVAWLS